MRKRRFKYGCFYCKGCRRYPKADEVENIKGRGGRFYCKACGTQVRIKPMTVGAEGDSQPILVLDTQLLHTIDWQKVESIATALGAATLEVLLS